MPSSRENFTLTYYRTSVKIEDDSVKSFCLRIFFLCFSLILMACAANSSDIYANLSQNKVDYKGILHKRSASAYEVKNYRDVLNSDDKFLPSSFYSTKPSFLPNFNERKRNSGEKTLNLSLPTSDKISDVNYYNKHYYQTMSSGGTNQQIGDQNILPSTSADIFERKEVATSGVIKKTSSGKCDITRHRCDDGNCIQADHYCDGVVHCGDYSDEPPGCSACNRTYYGRTGHSYLLNVPSLPSARAPPPRNKDNLSVSYQRKFKEDSPSYPSVCSVTFSSVGRGNGEIIQLTFSKFDVGRYISNSRTGASGSAVCEDGYLNIIEGGEQSKETEGKLRGGRRGGQWCGKGAGTNIYFSDQKSVTISIVTTKENLQQLPSLQIKYRFLRKSSAVVRFGTKDMSKYRGEHVSNTECSRILQGCTETPCTLQSPNFPGFYPRNITCYYLVKSSPPPTSGLRSIIVIGQPNNRLIHVGDQDLFSRVSPEVTLHQVCPGDHISIYDGGEMKAPLLAKFCGSTSLPNITSSGTEMLVVFHSSATGRMNHPPNMVVGFELIAHTLFKERIFENGCHYEINSLTMSHGTIHSPTNAMPSNSSCSYLLKGKPDEIVWFYFTKYYRKRMYDGNIEDQECLNGLLIEDNNESIKNKSSFATKNLFEIIGNYCNDVTPPVCIRYRENQQKTIPCTSKESFLSNSPNVLISQKFSDSTSLSPLEYIIYYEFVKLDKSSNCSDEDCHLFYNSDSKMEGSIFSPRSLFKYGRGGSKNLNYTHTFNLKEDEQLELKIMDVNFKNMFCKSVFSTHYDSYRCIKSYPNTASLRIIEKGWNNNFELDVGCICDNRSLPIEHVSRAKTVHLIFTIKNMTWEQDHHDFSFSATYKFSKTDLCDTNRTMRGIDGQILLGNSSVSDTCDTSPWTIRGNDHSYLFMHVPGSHPSSSSCVTKNRIVIFYEGLPVKAICPNDNPEEGTVSVFSQGWHERGPWTHVQEIVFKYVNKEKLQKYLVQWVEIRRDPQPPVLESVAANSGRLDFFRPKSSSAACPSECPEIRACINESLWCDGKKHCPSGADENSCNSTSFQWIQTLVLFGSATALTVVAITVLGITITHVYRQHSVKRRKRKQSQQMMSTQEVLLPLAHKHDTYYMSTS